MQRPAPYGVEKTAAWGRLTKLGYHLAAAQQQGCCSKHEVKLVIGTNNFGGRLDNVDEALVTLAAQGVTELDVARAYNGGATEESLGLALRKTNAAFTIATKTHFNQLGYSRVKNDCAKSLKALGRESVDIYYLHSPDGAATLTETLQAINELYAEGKFKKFAISNFTAWQTMQIIQLSKEHNWIQPKIYQGGYSAIQRHAERELLPLCRAHGISFYAYSPLARGLLTAKHKYDQPENQTHPFQEKFWTPSTFAALSSIAQACEEHGVSSVREAALRWLRFHSSLSVRARAAVCRCYCLMSAVALLHGAGGGGRCRDPGGVSECRSTFSATHSAHNLSLSLHFSCCAPKML